MIVNGAHSRSKSARSRAFCRGRKSRVVLKVATTGRDEHTRPRAPAGQGISKRAELTKSAMRLIFRPGFSTASIVSSVSGRGVGLDVVERAIELIGGELRVSSEEGAGTIFEMILPTTLALTPALVVHSAGYYYCIDEKLIAETGSVTAGEIDRSNEAEQVKWRGTLMPFVRVRHLLGQPLREDVNGESVPVIIAHLNGETESSEMRSAVLAVDAFGERTEALVRGLGRHAARWRGISGATKLPDGTVALVLDLPRLLEMNQSDNP